MDVGKMKFKKVSFTLEYIVPANPDAEDYARDCIYEDLLNFRKSVPYGWNNIIVEDAPDACEGDVPECVTEYLENTHE